MKASEGPRLASPSLNNCTGQLGTKSYELHSFGHQGPGKAGPSMCVERGPWDQVLGLQCFAPLVRRLHTKLTNGHSGKIRQLTADKCRQL